MIRNSLYGALTVGALLGFLISFGVFIALLNANVAKKQKDVEQLCQTHEKAVVLGCEDSQHSLNEALLQCEYLLKVRQAQIETCAEQLEIFIRHGKK